VLRPPAVYGPGDTGTFPLLRALTKPIAVIPGNSKARFSLIYVDDLARTIVEAAGATETGMVELDDGQRLGYDWLELVRIASANEQRSITPVFLPKPVAMSVAVIIEAFAKASGRPPFISRDKIRQLYHWDWLAKGAGWPLKARVGFTQGFKTTIDWYRQEQWLPQRGQ
jgi:nucleoside-diphosphate-sugar epimerase